MKPSIPSLALFPPQMLYTSYYMRRAISAGVKSIGLLTFIAFVLFPLGQSTIAAADACPEGTRPAKSADLPLMRAAGISGAVVGMCWDPTDADLGTTPSEAKTYLLSLPRQAVNGSRCAPPENDENIQRLNSTFAICAARFFRSYTAAYGNVLITSAFRDGTPGSSPNGGGESANQCAGGAEQSNHTIGIAMDVHPANGDYETMWEFASNNPQFGVCFPFQDGRINGYSDRPHMVLAGTGGNEASLCAMQGVVYSCEGQSYTPSTITYSPNVDRPVIEIAQTVGQYLYPDLTEEYQDSPYPLLSALIETIFSLPMTQNPSGNNDENNPFPFLTGDRPGIFSDNNDSPTSGGISIYSGWQNNPGGGSTSSPFILIVNGNDVTGIQNGTSSNPTIVWQGNTYQLTPVAQETFGDGTFGSNNSPRGNDGGSTFSERIGAGIASFFRGLLEYLTSFGN